MRTVHNRCCVHNAPHSASTSSRLTATHPSCMAHLRDRCPCLCHVCYSQAPASPSTPTHAPSPHLCGPQRGRGLQLLCKLLKGHVLVAAAAAHAANHEGAARCSWCWCCMGRRRQLGGCGVRHATRPVQAHACMESKAPTPGSHQGLATAELVSCCSTCAVMLGQRLGVLPASSCTLRCSLYSTTLHPRHYKLPQRCPCSKPRKG